MRGTFQAAAAVICSVFVVTGCGGDSGPSWCPAAGQMKIVKGEPDVIQLGIQILQIYGPDALHGDALQQAAAAPTAANVANALKRNMKKAGCPASDY